MIKIIGEELRQYDLGRQVELIPRGGATMKSVTFERGGVSLVTAIKEQDGKTVADIPNILLKAFGCLVVRYEGFDENGYEVEEKLNFTVHKREKPADYEYKETETLGLGNGGGASSWNDLTDKPFGDETPEPVVWNGDIEGRDTASAVINSLEFLFVKISDRVFKAADIIGATFSGTVGDSPMSVVVTESQIMLNNENSIVWGECSLVSTSVTTFAQGGINVTLPSPGTYVGIAPSMFNFTSVRMDFPAQVKTIETKYLPHVIFTMSTETRGTITCNKTYAEAYEILKVFPFALWSAGTDKLDGGLITRMDWSYYGNQGSASPTGIKFHRQLKDGTFDTFIFNENGLLAFEDDYFTQV